MKKLVCVLVLALLAGNILHAQSADVLTNASIIRMVKAKIADDIIIDMISTSPVNFNLSVDSINALLDENVSAGVLKAMETAYHPQPPVEAKNNLNQTIITEPEKPIVPDNPISTQPVVVKPKNTLIQPVIKDTVSTPKETAAQPPTIPKKDSIKQPEVKQTESKTEPPKKLYQETPQKVIARISENENSFYIINTISYVDPVKDLIIFFDEQTTSVTIFIQRWNRQINQLLEKEKRLMDTIAATGKELTAKKKEDAKLFDAEINNLKQRLSLFREEHEQSKTLIQSDGKNLVKEIKTLSDETDKLIGDKFRSVSKSVRNTNPDPSNIKVSATLKIAKQKTDDDLVMHIAPLTVIPACFQNEIIALQETITAWNEKTKAAMRQDSVFRSQLEPLDKELSQYLASPKDNQKQYKKEISALKKQIENVNKARKQLAKQMVDDSVKFSKILDNLGEEVKSVIKQRFTDAIENIEQSYQDKF